MESLDVSSACYKRLLLDMFVLSSIPVRGKYLSYRKCNTLSGSDRQMFTGRVQKSESQVMAVLAAHVEYIFASPLAPIFVQL